MLTEELNKILLDEKDDLPITGYSFQEKQGATAHSIYDGSTIYVDWASPPDVDQLIKVRKKISAIRGDGEASSLYLKFASLNQAQKDFIIVKLIEFLTNNNKELKKFINLEEIDQWINPIGFQSIPNWR